MNKLINDYIMGKDIPNVDMWENNPTFMKEVMFKTNDKKMFIFCGEDVKKDYDFVKFMLYYFQNDEKFASEVVKSFYNVATIEQKVDIGTIIENLYPETMDFVLQRYTLLAKAKFSLEAHKKAEGKNVNSLGFDEVASDKDDVNQEFIARLMVNKMFKKLKLQKLLHVLYKFEGMNKDDIESFILAYVVGEDQELAKYLASDMLAAKMVVDYIIKIQENWSKYEYNVVDNFIIDIEKLVFDKYTGEDRYEVLELLAQDLNMVDFFAEYGLIEDPSLDIVEKDNYVDFDGNIINVKEFSAILKSLQDEMRNSEEYKELLTQVSELVKLYSKHIQMQPLEVITGIKKTK